MRRADGDAASQLALGQQGKKNQEADEARTCQDADTDDYPKYNGERGDRWFESIRPGRWVQCDLLESDRRRFTRGSRQSGGKCRTLARV